MLLFVHHVLLVVGQGGTARQDIQGIFGSLLHNLRHQFFKARHFGLLLLLFFGSGLLVVVVVVAAAAAAVVVSL